METTDIPGLLISGSDRVAAAVTLLKMEPIYFAFKPNGIAVELDGVAEGVDAETASRLFPSSEARFESENTAIRSVVVYLRNYNSKTRQLQFFGKYLKTDDGQLQPRMGLQLG